MTTTHNRSRAVNVLNAHQPDDLNTTPTSIRCACGEDIPRQPEALAVHQVHQLDVLELLAVDPTEPLSLLALRDMSPGEVVFDGQGVAYVNTGAVEELGDRLWVSYDVGHNPAALWSSDELHAEHSPLATSRPPEAACVVCGCTDRRACPGGCWWASTDPPVCSRCAAVKAAGS